MSEIVLPVRAPDCAIVHGRKPCWEKAHGPDTFFDNNGYLHLPYGGGDYSDPDEVSVRVFFDRRDYREALSHRRIQGYRLENREGLWVWVVTIAGRG